MRDNVNQTEALSSRSPSRFFTKAKPAPGRFLLTPAPGKVCVIVQVRPDYLAFFWVRR